jgi:hypothetical protein
MRRPRLSTPALLSLVLVAACMRDAHSGAGNPKKGVNTVPATAPLALVLTVTPGPGLRAEIKNVSPQPQTYLVDDFHQPTRLSLRGPDGREIKGRDDARIKKRSNALERDAYETVAPAGADTLYEAEAVKEDDGYSLQWGSVHFDGLKPGAYAASLRWISALDEWTDPETGTTGREKGIWKGKLESSQVTIKLP